MPYPSDPNSIPSIPGVPNIPDKLDPSRPVVDGGYILGIEEPFFEDVTITVETTVDEFTTLTGTYYNSVPVTLTQFIKTTVVRPTVEVSWLNLEIPKNF